MVAQFKKIKELELHWLLAKQAERIVKSKNNFCLFGKKPMFAP